MCSDMLTDVYIHVKVQEWCLWQPSPLGGNNTQGMSLICDSSLVVFLSSAIGNIVDVFLFSVFLYVPRHCVHYYYSFSCDSCVLWCITYHIVMMAFTVGLTTLHQYAVVPLPEFIQGTQ